MKRFIIILTVALSSCAKPNYITMSPTTMSERDSLMLESQERFSDVSIVGASAEIITIERDKFKE